MRLPATEHTSRPWRIHAVAPDFRLEDVWALPAAGGPDDFPRLVRLMASYDPLRSSSRTVRAMFGVRARLGRRAGWDAPRAGLDRRVTGLRDRLPADLRDGPAGPEFESLPARSLYLAEDEWAAEAANQTVHGVLHFGWVPDRTGVYHGRFAILVKPNGRTGASYLAAIRPFRHLIVYPALLREIGREWANRAHRPAASARAEGSEP